MAELTAAAFVGKLVAAKEKAAAEEEKKDELIVHETGDEKKYNFQPFSGHTLRFKVKAATDCHISFASDEGESDQIVEVFIGGWEGQHSAIRFKQGDDLAKVETPDILSSEEYREFWIAKDHDEVRVGKSGDHEPFLSATLPEPIPAKFFGYSTGWGSAGSFQFLHERNLSTEDNLEYTFEPLYGDTLTFSVSCNNDAHIAFTSGPESTSPMYEIFIGGWKNQHSAIRRTKLLSDKTKEKQEIKVDTPDELCETMKTYWINTRGGHLRVGRMDETDHFIEWKDPEPFKPTHFGYCTGWGASGKWNLDV